MSDETTIEVGSNNVFADLGLPDPEEYLVKSELARLIAEAIRERHLTQAQAAQLMGIEQPKVSNILRGRLGGFSMERLMRCLTSLGHRVRIVVEKGAASPPVDSIPILTIQRKAGRSSQSRQTEGRDGLASARTATAQPEEEKKAVPL